MRTAVADTAPFAVEQAQQGLRIGCDLHTNAAPLAAVAARTRFGMQPLGCRRHQRAALCGRLIREARVRRPAAAAE